MKTIRNIIKATCLLLLVCSSFAAYAQIPSSGTFELTEDITLTSKVSIASTKTLTIVNRTGRDIKITAGSQFTSNMFDNSGTLNIIGENGRIIIDGGAGFTLKTTMHPELDIVEDISLEISGTKRKTIAAAINNTGTLTLDGVTIQNVDDSGSNGGAIQTNSSKNKPVNITNCIIQNCVSSLGAAIMITGGTADINISNSSIIGCISGGTATERAGGAIRTYGSVSSSLYLTNVTFRYNYAKRTTNYNDTWDRDGSGAAIFWNGRGLVGTECVMDGCLFEYNKCDDNGGAIKTQGSISFKSDVTKKQTIIQKNTAPNGAGLYIEGYDGGSGVGDKRTITYNLNESLLIQDNVALPYTHAGKTSSGKGAGVHFYFGSGMDLEANSTINVIFN